MTFLRRRWLWLLVPVVGVAAFVVVWFEPQALFIDERVSEPVPVVAEDRPSDIAPAASTTMPPEPVELAAGDLVSIDHGTSGRVRVLQLADGSRYVRLEGLRTENGPALKVYLSQNPAGGPEGAFDEAFVDLGDLQGNLGDQNYLVPPDAEPLAYASVVIWCERFDSAFGAADLLAT
jgi:hypothetical protein